MLESLRLGCETVWVTDQTKILFNVGIAHAISSCGKEMLVHKVTVGCKVFRDQSKKSQKGAKDGASV